MCGRAAQTVHASHCAARLFGMDVASRPTDKRLQETNSQVASSSKDGKNTSSSRHEEGNASVDYHKIDRDNYNMSPGMDALVMWMEDGKIKMDRKVWGLVIKGGSQQNPLPSDSKERMGMHFGGLMYNARTDTLFTKPTFSRLAKERRSCVVALDGYFEWKTSPLAGGKGKKQPYFVHRKQSSDGSSTSPPFLLLAGLWTKVPTGLIDEPILETFTILTTEACKQIEWLHHRMPVCLWDLELARKWLTNPSAKVHEEVDLAAKTKNDGFAWHMVTTEMSSVKFRGEEAIKEKKGPMPVTAFFSKMASQIHAGPHSTTPPKQSEPLRKAALEENDKTNASEEHNDVHSQSEDSHGRNLKRKGSTTESPMTPKASKKTRPNPSPASKGLITSFFEKAT